MLKGIDPVVSPELLKALAEMGHGDEILFADAHFPGRTNARELIRADGLSVDRVLKGVAPLIEGSDIIIYAFGDDVADWHPYKTENERFMLLWRSGFRYFCNVDSNRVWVQKGNDYLRQGRRNLDGQRMWQDLSTGSDHLSDLFDVKEVFDQGRPTPVE